MKRTMGHLKETVEPMEVDKVVDDKTVDIDKDLAEDDTGIREWQLS
jgi:hypothetical protein